MTSVVAAPRPGLRAWGYLTLTEAKAVVRDTPGLVIPIGLPVLLLAMNGLGQDRTPNPDLGGLPVFDAIVVPLNLAMIIAIIGIVNMPSFLAEYRRAGVLRRLAVTPAHPAMVLVAQVVVSTVQAVVGIALALTVAWLAFGLSAPRALGWAIVVLLVTAAAMYAVGMVVAAVARGTNDALALGLTVFFGTLATGGGFGPRENLPDWLARVGELLPYGAAGEALSAAWMGDAPALRHVGALVVVAVAGALVAAWRFRWD